MWSRCVMSPNRRLEKRRVLAWHAAAMWISARSRSELMPRFRSLRVESQDRWGAGLPWTASGLVASWPAYRGETERWPSLHSRRAEASQGGKSAAFFRDRQGYPAERLLRCDIFRWRLIKNHFDGAGKHGVEKRRSRQLRTFELDGRCRDLAVDSVHRVADLCLFLCRRYGNFQTGKVVSGDTHDLRVGVHPFNLRSETRRREDVGGVARLERVGKDICVIVYSDRLVS